jgi:hypothetical protein
LKPAKYSYSWAQSVIDKLKEKYPRATETVCIILDITEKDLAKYLAIGDNIFPQLRELIRMCDNWIKTSSPEADTIQVCSCGSWYLRRKGWERIADRLDEVRNRDKMKEQVSRGAVLGAVGDDGQLPFIFD